MQIFPHSLLLLLFVFSFNNFQCLFCVAAAAALILALTDELGVNSRKESKLVRQNQWIWIKMCKVELMSFKVKINALDVSFFLFLFYYFSLSCILESTSRFNKNDEPCEFISYEREIFFKWKKRRKNNEMEILK